jgi:hypothetical protein
MFTTKLLTRTITIVTVFMLALSGVSPAFAAGNDNFADATPIGVNSLPFNTNADTTGATFEVDEPYPSNCSYGYPLKTVWFAYTPSTTATLTARVNYYNFPTILAVYTGSSLNNLTQISCSQYYYNSTFQAQAGVTYYFQMSSLYDWYEGTIPFSLEVTPPPQVNFYYYPSDPNTYDNISFNSSVYDPGQIYGLTYAWTTSDGATSNQGGFSHQFAADGDYNVNLTVTTADGRSGSASQVVQVRTKDVAISKFTIPQTAKVNTTKTISVDVLNKRYSDYVQVTLFKGLPGGGEQLIGTLTIYVPAKAKQATTFKFSYTFTSEDAAIGKVTFRAVASIVNGRDALPADNTSIATTKVSGGVSYP